MNKQRKKLTLNKETLRDLTADNAGWVKGGPKGGNATHNKKCVTRGGPTCPSNAPSCGTLCYSCNTCLPC